MDKSNNAALNRVRKVRDSRVFMLWDIPVFAVIIILTVSLLIAAFTQPKGDRVSVYISSSFVASYDLNIDREEAFTSKDGKYSLMLVIKDSAAYVVDADCPDHLCEKSGAIRYVHQTIVCLPAYIVVKIEGSSLVDGAL